MILFVKVSPRRWIAVESPTRPHGWRSPESVRGIRAPEQPGIVYASIGMVDVIAGPADWETVTAAAYEHAKSRGELKTYAEWEAVQRQRDERLKQINEAIKARGLGIGAVLTHLEED